MHIKNCSFRLMFKWIMNNFVIITFVWFGKFIFIYTYKYCIHMNIIRIQFNISSKFNIPLSEIQNFQHEIKKISLKYLYNK